MWPGATTDAMGNDLNALWAAVEALATKGEQPWFEIPSGVILMPPQQHQFRVSLLRDVNEWQETSFLPSIKNQMMCHHSHRSAIVRKQALCYVWPIVDIHNFRLCISWCWYLDGSSIHQPVSCCSLHLPGTCSHPVPHTYLPSSLWSVSLAFHFSF